VSLDAVNARKKYFPSIPVLFSLGSILKLHLLDMTATIAAFVEFSRKFTVFLTFRGPGFELQIPRRKSIKNVPYIIYSLYTK